MKKKLLALLLALGMLLSLAACGPKESSNPTPPANNSQQPNNPGNQGSDNPLAGTYDNVMWVSETAGVSDLFAEQVKAFEAANPGIVINATIEGISESEAATQMITSVEDGADIFCFAQDQIARLMMAGALNTLGQGASEQVRTMNDAGSVASATTGGNLVAFPLTSDNGIFLFYDKSIIKEEDVGSLEALIAACEAADRNFSFYLEGSAWYNASFFFATGCHSSWTMDPSGTFTSVDDDFNSDAGVIALKGMQKLLQSKCYNNSETAADFGAATPSAVVVCGPWATTTVRDILGDNMGAVELPSFEVDGQTYHLGSYSGYKLMGIKPQTDATKAAVLQQLALYLTGEECQTQRFEKLAWGPSNLNAQANPAVQADIALSALAAQNAYAVPQGQISGSWWDIGKLVATSAKEAPAGDDAALKAVLENYQTSIDGLFQMTAEELRAWSVIGSLMGYSWDTDIPMTETAPGVWVTDPLTLNAGDEFKVRQGKSWDVNLGSTGLDGANFVAEESGTFVIQLTVSGEGAATTGTVELIPG